MWAVVPNMHDSITRVIHPVPASGDVRDGQTGLLDSGSEPPEERWYSRSDDGSHYHFVHNGRSSQTELVQEVDSPEPDDKSLINFTRKPRNHSRLEGALKHFSFLSSVVVIPKSSGKGYEVYQSPVPIHRDDPVTDYVPPVQARASSTSPSMETHTDMAAESVRNRTATPLPPTQSQASMTKAAKFSLNIGNLAKQKNAEEKLNEAKSRAEMFRSTRVNSRDDQPAVNIHGLRPTKSKPSTPTLIRKSRERSSPVIPKDTNSRLADRLMHSPTETSRKLSSTSPAASSSSPGPLSQPGRTSVSPTLKNDDALTLHESLSPWDGTRTNTSVPTASSDRPSDMTKSMTAPPKKVDHGPVRGFLASLKIRLSPQKLKNNQKQNRQQQSQQTEKQDRQQQQIKQQRKQSKLKQYQLQHSRHSSDGSADSVNLGDRHVGCNCQGYHHHSFSGQAVNSDLEARKEKRQQIITSSLNLREDLHADNLEDPRSVFWTPSLSFHPYKHGDKRVTFTSLWPKYKELRDLLQNSGVQQTVLSPDAVLDICILACTCGPVHLLQCLVELDLIRIDQVVESGAGLLHLALLAQNVESAQFLMAAKISPKIRDQAGLTADQVCFNPSIRKQMAPRYVLNRELARDKMFLKPTSQDKDSIFRLASNPRHFVDIQKKLQTLDFNVNTECDQNGDFLLHIAVSKGLNQLPLLMALVNIQKADIELCNADGMTPLMIAAAAGNCVLCDVLICLFGADPNKRSSQSGRSALHYAAEGNHRKTVECLIRRGADINMEDHDGLRADDVPVCAIVTDDCRELIAFNRHKRLEMLSAAVKKGEVVSSQVLPSDLCVVDGDGNTLIMIAAAVNRFQTLHCLLGICTSTLNAQHTRTGMTALALAAKMGHEESVSVLLRYRACPSIADMAGYLPIHHAVMNNHEGVVDVFLDYFPDTYVSLYKAMRLCKKTALHTKLRSAWERRQEEIVTPKLLGCTLNGDAEELFLLLDEGDSINPKSGTGNWPLYLAVENGHLDVLKLLFERGGDIRKRHPTTGATALHLAAKMGHQSIISYLLQYCRNYENNLPVSALQIINPEEPPKPGHSPGRRKRMLDVNAVDRDNKTALQLAAEKGFSRIVDLLLSYGATTALLDSSGNLVTCPQYEGVRIMIESRRQQHTHQILKAIEEKSKKCLPMLQQIWLPKFDHNLRTKEGSTPLMVAAGTGKLEVVQFLLESAVYPEVIHFQSDSDDSDSDTDSGMLDPTSPKDNSKNDEEFQASHEGGSVAYSVTSRFPQVGKYDLFNSSLQGRDISDNSEFHHRRLTQIVYDANRPKGLSVFHDGLVSHVCAVNLLDGTNVLHHSVQNTDAVHILNVCLDADCTPLNMQDNRGETVLHTACRLKRKKCVEFILARPDLDLNIRTFEGHLPEEVTTSKVIQKLVKKARLSSPDLPIVNSPRQHTVSICGSDTTVSFSGSTVNFDRIHSRYETLKNDTKIT